MITLTRCPAPLRGLSDGVRPPEAAALEIAVSYIRCAAMPAGGDGGLETRLEELMRLAAEIALARIAVLCPDAVK